MVLLQFVGKGDPDYSIYEIIDFPRHMVDRLLDSGNWKIVDPDEESSKRVKEMVRSSSITKGPKTKL